MSNVTFTQLTAWTGSIDGANDLIAVWKNSNSTLYKATQNQVLNLTSQPVGISDSQTISNKINDNSNTYTSKDNAFTIQNSSDTTKRAVFNASGITTGTTRTLTLPNASVTLASLTGTEIFTNKTLTSPAITGGTIDNSTITVDSISGHTSATTVTVGGVQLNNGTLNTNNAVTTASVADAAVTPAKLTAGTGSSWVMQSWSPTFSNLTVGNSVVTAGYIQVGKMVFIRLNIKLGNTSAVGTSPSVAAPVAPKSAAYNPGSENVIIGQAYYVSGGVAVPGLLIFNNSATNIQFIYTPTATSVASLSATTPGTWTTNDYINCEGWYEAA